MKRLFLIIFLLAFLVRLPGLGQFMTADEANWMIRSGEFWNNLFLNNDPGGTYRTTHPGVITMWVAGSGIFIQQLRLGYHIDDGNLAQFRLAAMLPLALVTSLLIASAAVWMKRLWPKQPYIWLTGVFLALSPYLTGMSQIVHLDAILALAMLQAILLWLLAAKAESPQARVKYLVIGGLYAGVAALNKFLPALWLLPSLFAIVWLTTQSSFWVRCRRAFISILFVIGVMALLAAAIWPALTMVKDLGRTFTRDTITVATTQHVDIAQSDDFAGGKGFYVRTWLSRTTPFDLLVGLAVVWLVVRAALRSKRPDTLLLLIVYGVSFLLFVALPAKQADRYALPGLVIWPVLAAIGVGWALNKVPKAATLGLPLLLLTLSGQVLLMAPDAIAYNNPLWPNIRPLSQQGWGEGLEQAAAWLNEQKFDIHLSVASWYPTVLAPYFHGDTYSLSSRNDVRVGMVVLYRNMQGRGSDDEGTNIWDEYKNQTPVKIFSIAGQPYVWIYDSLTIRYFPKMIGELIDGMEVGQTVPVTQANWSRIDIGMSNFSGRNNTHDVTLHIKDSPDALADIRTVAKAAGEVIDSDWNTFTFAPIADSSGKTFYVSLTSPESTPGNAITVKFSKQPIKPGDMYVRREPLAAGKQMSDFKYDGSLAYRLH